MRSFSTSGSIRPETCKRAVSFTLTIHCGGRVLTKSRFPSYTFLMHPAVDAGCFSLNISPKLAFGKMVLITKPGFLYFANFQISCSACVLLAPYTAHARLGSYGGGFHAASTSLVFQSLILISNLSFGLGAVMAVDEDVYTKRLTDGSLAADSAARRAPAITWGMTLFGSGSRVRMEARCATPDTP